MDIHAGILNSILNFQKIINATDIDKIRVIKNNGKPIKFNKKSIKVLKESQLLTFTCLRILLGDL